MRHVPVFGEAVQDAACLAGVFFFQHAQGICRGFAVMHDERFTGLPRRADVCAEAFPLPFGRVLVPVIIETGFTNADDFGMGGQTR